MTTSGWERWVRHASGGSGAPAWHAIRASTIRGALVTGFVLVFGLWSLSGYELLRSLENYRQRTAAADEMLLQGETVLDVVRTNVLLGSVYLRDALMAETPARREYYRAELQRIHAEVNRALELHLDVVSDPSEQAEWSRLRQELDGYWLSREAVLNSRSVPTVALGQTVTLEVQATPVRQAVLAIVDTLARVQRESRARHEQEAVALHVATRNRVTWMAILAFVIGIVVAIVAATHVGRLGQEIERQRLAEQSTRQNLERLSAGLVNSQEKERRALARELHDAVGQALTAINMDVEVALRDGGLRDRARGALRDARTVAESTLQSIRNLSQLLHPPVLSDFGLIEAIRVHLRSFTTHSGVRAELVSEPLGARLPTDVELCAYRIVQEALTNVARHSGATSCVVALSRRGDVLRVSVEDDGRGLGSAAVGGLGHRGLGLLAMRERAQALNGSLIIEGRAEGGTRVVLQLPAPGRDDQDEWPDVELRRPAV